MSWKEVTWCRFQSALTQVRYDHGRPITVGEHIRQKYAETNRERIAEGKEPLAVPVTRS